MPGWAFRSAPHPCSIEGLASARPFFFAARPEAVPFDADDAPTEMMTRLRIGGAVLLLAAALAACRTRAPSSSPSPGRPVIFLGLDAADWSLLDQYIARGVMPTLATLAA